MNNLMVAFVRCSKSHQLIKLYREVVSNVIRF